MGKYTSLQNDIFSIFNTDLWIAENIKVWPDNAVPVGNTGEFLRLSVIPSGDGINMTSVSGVLIVDIFTAAGNGPNRASLLADKLDLYLVGQSIVTGVNRTQFSASALEYIGRDSDNKSLFRSVYSIPFNYFGVST